MPENEARRRDIPRNLKGYFLCLLRKGPQWNQTGDSPALMLEHLSYMRQQIEARRYVVAGPVVGPAVVPFDAAAEDDLVGMTILTAETPEEAQALVDGDPGVKAGRLRTEVRPVFLPSLDAVRVEY